jgi:hypothetical protein
MTNTEELLKQRNTTHGSFLDNANISQSLKGIMHRTHGWSLLGVAQQEALDMIALKISRILSGQNSHQDHWDDIAGYASLGAKH